MHPHLSVPASCLHPQTKPQGILALPSMLLLHSHSVVNITTDDIAPVLVWLVHRSFSDASRIHTEHRACFFLIHPQCRVNHPDYPKNQVSHCPFPVHAVYPSATWELLQLFFFHCLTMVTQCHFSQYECRLNLSIPESLVLIFLLTTPCYVLLYRLQLTLYQALNSSSLAVSR